MSSLPYGNGILPSHDDISIPPILPSSGAVIQHPYLTSNTNAAYAAAAVAAAAASSASASSLGQYPSYYGHQLPQQPLLPVQQASPFYPATAVNHLQHHGDFSNSSSSVASSSSIESSRKPTNRKRPTDKTAMPTRSTSKRKAVCYLFRSRFVFEKNKYFYFRRITMMTTLMMMMTTKKINVVCVVHHYQVQ